MPLFVTDDATIGIGGCGALVRHRLRWGSRGRTAMQDAQSKSRKTAVHADRVGEDGGVERCSNSIRQLTGVHLPRTRTDNPCDVVSMDMKSARRTTGSTCTARAPRLTFPASAVLHRDICRRETISHPLMLSSASFTVCIAAHCSTAIGRLLSPVVQCGAVDRIRRGIASTELSLVILKSKLAGHAERY
jgi:hypothetical protein